MKLVIIIIACLSLSAFDKVSSQSLSLSNNRTLINVGDIDIKGNQITVEALIFLNQDTLLNDIVSKHTGIEDVNYLLRPLTFELTTYVSGDTGKTKFLQMYNPFKLSLNKWYHVAGTYNGTVVRYYVDGCLAIELPFSGNLFQSDLATAIGNQSSCRCEQYFGRIDEVRIWNVCRSQTEILNNMLTIPNPTSQPGLVAYYKFDGDIINSQGNPNWNGIMIGTTAFSASQASIQPLEITAMQSSNADCLKTNNGSITVSCNRPDAVYSINGRDYKAANTFTNLGVGKYNVYVKIPEGCILDSVVQVGNNNFLITNNISTTICEGYSFLGYSSSGTFVDTVISSKGCDSLRTLRLNVKPKSLTRIDQSICEGTSFLGYTSTGTYIDTFVSANGCDSIRTINLIVRPKSYASINQTICEGESFAGYTTPGTYVDTLVAINGCDSIRTIKLTVLRKPSPYLGEDQNLCKGDSLILFPGLFDSYKWQDSSGQSRIKVKESGIYSVTVNNFCGTAIEQIIITQINCVIHPPNVFSPNGDGINDTWVIPYLYTYTDCKVDVFNRYGQRVFHSDGYNRPWNGTVNGHPLPFGTYYWVINLNSEKAQLKGSVTIIR